MVIEQKAGLFLASPPTPPPHQPPPATFKRPQTLVYAVSTARGAAPDALPLSKDGAAAPTCAAAPASPPPPPAAAAPAPTSTPFPDPPYVTLAGVTLRYAGWFREAVPGCAAEGEGRVRKVVLALHLSDSTATLLEPRTPNSGLDQGVLVRRHALMVGGVPLTADAVAVGTTVRRGAKGGGGGGRGAGEGEGRAHTRAHHALPLPPTTTHTHTTPLSTHTFKPAFNPPRPTSMAAPSRSPTPTPRRARGSPAPASPTPGRRPPRPRGSGSERSVRRRQVRKRGRGGGEGRAVFCVACVW